MKPENTIPPNPQAQNNGAQLRGLSGMRCWIILGMSLLLGLMGCRVDHHTSLRTPRLVPSAVLLQPPTHPQANSPEQEQALPQPRLRPAPVQEKVQKAQPRATPRPASPKRNKYRQNAGQGETKTLSFAVVGDIMMSPKILRGAYTRSCKCYRFGPMFEHIKPWIEKADVAIANLETTFPGPKGGYTGFPFFGAPDELGWHLKRIGFDVMVTANNHIFDKKTAGLVRTLDVLDRMKYQHVGAYRSLEENKGKRFIVIQKNGIRLALLAYTSHVNSYHSLRKLQKYHVNYMRYNEIKEDLQAIRKHKFDMVSVYMHSWPEYKNHPHPYQKKRVGWFLKWGADMVLGSHPHVLQPIDMLRTRDKFGKTKHRFVAWSLGNFISSMSGFYTSGSIMLFFTLEKKRDANGKWKTRVSQVSYEPIWVYRKRVREGRRRVWKFSVLPISKFRNNDQPLKLDRRSYQRMLRYDRFVRRHLKKGLAKIRRMIASGS